MQRRKVYYNFSGVSFVKLVESGYFSNQESIKKSNASSRPCVILTYFNNSLIANGGFRF